MTNISYISSSLTHYIFQTSFKDVRSTLNLIKKLDSNELSPIKKYLQFYKEVLPFIKTSYVSHEVFLLHPPTSFSACEIKSITMVNGSNSKETTSMGIIYFSMNNMNKKR